MNLAEIATADLVREVNRRCYPCRKGHEADMLALWPCWRCAVEKAVAEEADRWRSQVKVCEDVGTFEVRDDGEGPYWFGGCPGDKDALAFAVGQDLILAPGAGAWPVGSRVEGWLATRNAS